MSVWGLSDNAAARLRDLMAAHDGTCMSRGRGGVSSSPIVFVKCTDDTAVGGNSVLAQCYPGQILTPASDYALPPELGGYVLLTVIDSAGEAAVPVLDSVYLCVLSGDVASDASGSGSQAVDGRPRAFGVVAASTGEFRGVLLRHSANQSIAASTDTALSFDTEVYDEGDYHSTSSNTSRITIPADEDGYYLVGGAIQYAASATGARAARIRKNGSTILSQHDTSASAGGTNPSGVETSIPVYLAAGDYVELIAWQSTLGALNALAVNPSYPNFWAIKVTSTGGSSSAPTLVSGEVIDTSSVTVDASTPGTWTTPALSTYTLPSSGTYLVTVRLTASCRVSAIVGFFHGQMRVRLYDVTAGAAINGTTVTAVEAPTIDAYHENTVTIQRVITVSVATTIRVETFLRIGATYYTGSVDNAINVSSGEGRPTVFSYVKIGQA